MYCTKCGVENIENANFCRACGAALKKKKSMPCEIMKTKQLHEREKHMELFELVEKISVINHDNGTVFTEPKRLGIINEILVNSKYKFKNDSGLCHIYAKKDLCDLPDKIVVVSSHIDTHPGITEPYAKILDKNTWEGTFDNSITNAVLMKCMLDDALDENVIIAFTGDEEVEGRGARDVCRYLNSYKKEPFVVVLDITGEGYREECDLSIENNFFRKAPIRETIFDEVEKLDCNWCFVSSKPKSIPRFIKDRYISHVVFDGNRYLEADEDESWEYDENSKFAFSFCIPVDDLDKEHSNTGVKIRTKSLKKYSEAFIHVVNRMNKELKNL